MKKVCERCGVPYNDFDHSTICPHDRIAFSDSALKHLVDQGIVCKRCERHVEECECGNRDDGREGGTISLATGDIVFVRRHPQRRRAA